MRLPALIAAGFALHALLGPLCMAMPLEANAPRETAAHHHDAGGECPHCDHDAPEASDCAGHCLSQATHVSTAPATGAPDIPSSHFARTVHGETDAASNATPVGRAARPPGYLASIGTTVLRL